ncbi:hypothetical protein Glove_606g197 [Diversispora epigaea]|uniref:Uncharacterized protein n=1 Tax=Diversispora epigaea TaxID=1348612 RepID=A0A397G6T2_9GLOM|nr:hypothetical protein Glove_606g197 [Diversispora epigaea]
MADMSNDKKNFTSNESQDAIIKMWIPFEGHPRSTKLKADLSQVTDLSCILKEKFQELKNVEPLKIIFNYNDHTKPLVVRYPISDLSSKYFFSANRTNLFADIVNFRYYRIPSFQWGMGTISKKRRIFIYEFIDLNELKECVLDLKVQTKGKKAFGDWSLKEVASEIYNSDFDKLDIMRQFNIKDLSELRPQISKEEIELVDQLKTKASAFKNRIDTNEATVREYVSIFMTQAVYHIQQYKDSTTTLSIESELDGSRGYGNLDLVEIQDVPILINDMEKGIAQNLVQVYTAAEVKDSNSLPHMMFIVTMGYVWRFIRWSGTLQYPRPEITPFARLLQAQADALKDNQDKERDSKRHKKDEGS